MRRILTGVLIALAALIAFSALCESVPYRVNLPGGMPIYQGPGYGYGYEKDVEADGVYTIVEEAFCEYGYLWGRLKSGAGWVRLSVSAFENENWYKPQTHKIPAWASVFKGPGYDYDYYRPVGENGVYTIMEEAYDGEGNLWGRLKSGLGWVDLTNVACLETQPVVIAYADKELLESGEFIFRQKDAGEYSVKIAVHPNERLKSPRFTSLDYSGEYWTNDEVLYSAWYMWPGNPLVMQIDFPGDMSAYEFSCIDESGVEHRYMITISARNGSLQAMECISE